VRAVLKEESQTLMRKGTRKYRKAMYAIAGCIALSLLAALFKSYLAPISKFFHQ
jgi:hypothetical protein